MNRLKLKFRLEKLLEEKNNSFKRKYYILSETSAQNITNDKDKKSEFVSYLKTLVETNARFPDESALVDFYSQQLHASRKNSMIQSLKETLDLKYNRRHTHTVTDLINEEFQKIDVFNSKINKKLYLTMLEGMNKRISILNENDSGAKDAEAMFDDVNEPSQGELDQIEAEDDFTMPDELPEDSGKTVDKIAQIFSSVSGKDPRKVSKKELASMLGYTGLGKYSPTEKTYKLSGWEKLERDIVRKMDPYKNTGISVIAKRKWWIIKSIETCLMLEKQANKAFGTPEDVKSKFNIEDKEQMTAVQSVAKSRRRSGSSLSDAEGRMIMDDLHEELTKGNYDLESSSISENKLMALLVNSARFRGGSAKQFASDLEIMYPLTDQRADFEKVPMQSDEERQSTQQDTKDYFKRKEDETREVYGDEIDPETGEPLYADEEQIRNINMQKREEQDIIKKEEIIKDMSKANYLNFTAKEAAEHMSKISDDLKRLGELESKTNDKVNPEIFSEFKKDLQGNIVADISAIPDVIPAQDLTDEEKKEVEEIIERLAAVDIIRMINDNEREEIYQELVDKSVTVDEFIAYNKKFDLDNPDKPMTWEDIKRASAGEFTGSAGSRQYGVKAWIKSVFFNFSPSDKSDIYSYIAERWYERLKQLDLVDDQAFAIKSDKVSPGDPSKDKAVSRKFLDAAEASGKYKRSEKLVDISNMLELVSKYTSPKYVKRYFDEKREDNLPQSVSEKLYQIQAFASSIEEYDTLVKRLETEDPDTMAFAIMESMFNDKSGFRMFATGLMKEYYNNNVWPKTEIALAQAVKKYFEKNYPMAGIAKSLAADAGASEVRPEEGKNLFNKIIYVAMERTGIKTSGKGVPNVGDSVEERKEYLRGNLDSRGDFAKSVADYNIKYQSGKRPISGKYGSIFDKDDVEDLIEDIFNINTGIIGKVSAQLKRLNATSASEIITWIGAYPEAKLDQAIVLGMALADFYRREDISPMMTFPIIEIGKDTAKSVADYKKKYGKQLTSSDFVEWLDDYLGIEPVDLKAKGSKNPAGKSFQWEFKMYLQEIMTNYLNEEKRFDIENSFRPLTVKKSTWETSNKRLLKKFKFDKTKFLEQFIVEIIKYNRETPAQLEIRFKNKTVAVLIHASSADITEIELDAAQDVDKIKKDVMYYYAK